MKKLDKKSKIIIVLSIILIAVLAAITYIYCFSELEMETVDLNYVSVNVPKKIDFNLYDENYSNDSSNNGYFVAVFNLISTNISHIMEELNIDENDLMVSYDNGNGGQSNIYKTSGKLFSYVAFYRNGNVGVIIEAPNPHVLELMLDSIVVFSPIEMPSVNSNVTDYSDIHSTVTNYENY